MGSAAGLDSPAASAVAVAVSAGSGAAAGEAIAGFGGEAIAGAGLDAANKTFDTLPLLLVVLLSVLVGVTGAACARIEPKMAGIPFPPLLAPPPPA